MGFDHIQFEINDFGSSEILHLGDTENEDKKFLLYAILISPYIQQIAEKGKENLPEGVTEIGVDDLENSLYSNFNVFQTEKSTSEHFLDALFSRIGNSGDAKISEDALHSAQIINGVLSLFFAQKENGEFIDGGEITKIDIDLTAFTDRFFTVDAPTSEELESLKKEVNESFLKREYVAIFGANLAIAAGINGYSVKIGNTTEVVNIAFENFPDLSPEEKQNLLKELSGKGIELNPVTLHFEKATVDLQTIKDKILNLDLDLEGVPDDWKENLNALFDEEAGKLGIDSKNLNSTTWEILSHKVFNNGKFIAIFGFSTLDLDLFSEASMQPYDMIHLAQSTGTLATVIGFQLGAMRTFKNNPVLGFIVGILGSLGTVAFATQVVEPALEAGRNVNKYFPESENYLQKLGVSSDRRSIETNFFVGGGFIYKGLDAIKGSIPLLYEARINLGTSQSEWFNQTYRTKEDWNGRVDDFLESIQTDIVELLYNLGRKGEITKEKLQVEIGKLLGSPYGNTSPLNLHIRDYIINLFAENFDKLPNVSWKPNEGYVIENKSGGIDWENITGILSHQINKLKITDNNSESLVNTRKGLDEEKLMVETALEGEEDLAKTFVNRFNSRGTSHLQNNNGSIDLLYISSLPEKYRNFAKKLMERIVGDNKFRYDLLNPAQRYSAIEYYKGILESDGLDENTISQLIKESGLIDDKAIDLSKIDNRLAIFLYTLFTFRQEEWLIDKNNPTEKEMRDELMGKDIFYMHGLTEKDLKYIKELYKLKYGNDGFAELDAILTKGKEEKIINLKGINGKLKDFLSELMDGGNMGIVMDSMILTEELDKDFINNLCENSINSIPNSKYFDDSVKNALRQQCGNLVSLGKQNIITDIYKFFDFKKMFGDNFRYASNEINIIMDSLIKPLLEKYTFDSNKFEELRESISKKVHSGNLFYSFINRITNLRRNYDLVNNLSYSDYGGKWQNNNGDSVVGGKTFNQLKQYNYEDFL